MLSRSTVRKGRPAEVARADKRNRNKAVRSKFAEDIREFAVTLRSSREVRPERVAMTDPLALDRDRSVIAERRDIGETSADREANVVPWASSVATAVTAEETNRTLGDFALESSLYVVCGTFRGVNEFVESYGRVIFKPLGVGPENCSRDDRIGTLD